MIDLLDGRHQAASDRPSILHFTVERAASRFVGTLMHDLARDSGMTPIDLDGYHFELATIDDWLPLRGGESSALYRSRGYQYGPFRTSTDHLLDRGDYRILISVRDPRDVLVSLYHNYAYEEARPRLANASQLRERRRKAARFREQSIDEFVLDFLAEQSHIRTSYEAYCQRLGNPNVLLVRYEDMLEDFDAWLERVLTFLRLQPSDRVLQRIHRLADFTPAPDTGRGARRQVLPGDHQRRLDPRTVESLTSACRHILPVLGYELDPRY